MDEKFSSAATVLGWIKNHKPHKEEASMSMVRYFMRSSFVRSSFVYCSFECSLAGHFIKSALALCSGLSRWFLVSLLVAFPLSAAADFNRAVQHFAAERYPAALEEFSQLAELGHTGSQFNLGAMHYLGQGVAQNNIEAFAWIALATETSDATAKSLRDRLWSRFDDSQREQAQGRLQELQENVGKDALQKNLWPLVRDLDPQKQSNEHASSAA